MTRSSKRWPAAAIVLVVGVAVGACSSGSNSPAVPSVGASSPTTASRAGAPSSGGNTPLAQGLAYSQCIRNHGVPNFPDPVPTPSGGYGYRTLGVNPQSSSFRSAQEACRSLAPQWWTGGQQLSSAQQQQWLDWAKCIRAHGVPDFADPTFSGSQVHITPGGGVGGSPQVQSAMNACKSQMPSSGGVGG